MKNSYKLLLTFLFFGVSYLSYAQVCAGESTNLTVDTEDENGNSQPGGTLGSTYTWSIKKTTDNDSNSFISTTDGNKVTINWPANAEGVYTVSALETNNNCEGELVTFNITVNARPTEPTVTNNGPICKGNNGVFTITGTAGDEVTYTIDGGAAQTTTIGANGTVEVNATNITIDTTLTITEVKNTGGCATTGLNIKSTLAVTELAAAPTITNDGPVCNGRNGVFTITGTAGDEVTYTIDGGAAQTTTIGTNGTVEVNATNITEDTTLTITEVKNTGGCATTGLNVSNTIKVTELATAPTITNDGPICKGNNGVFTITGTAGNEVTYTIDGGAAQTTTIGTNGTVEVNATNMTEDTTLTITEVKNTGGCATTGLNVTSKLDVIIVETSEIKIAN